MSFLYDSNIAIKECLKRAQGYRVEGCGLACHGLLVFKQRLGSIKPAFVSASGVHEYNALRSDDSRIWGFINSFHSDENNRSEKHTSAFTCKYRDMQEQKE